MDDTQTVGCLFYEDIITKYAPEAQEYTSTINPERQKIKRQSRDQAKRLLDLAAQYDEDPGRSFIMKSAINLVNELDLIDLTYDTVERLLWKYFPDLNIENVVKYLVILGKAVSLLFSSCKILQQAYMRSAASPWERLLYLTASYVQNIVCQYVRANGGWSIVIKKCTEFVADNWPLLAALGAVAAVGVGVGIAMSQSKSKRK